MEGRRPGPRGVDDQLWKRFRGAQDQFFGARDAANAELDQEFAANAEKKEALLVEAEALLPVTDLRAAKEAFRDIAERWDAAGKVPRDRMKELEGRMRKVEQAIRGVEDDQWRRSEPRGPRPRRRHGRQLESSIAELEAKATRPPRPGTRRRPTSRPLRLEAVDRRAGPAERPPRPGSRRAPFKARRAAAASGGDELARRDQARAGFPPSTRPRTDFRPRCCGPVGALGERPRNPGGPRE